MLNAVNLTTCGFWRYCSQRLYSGTDVSFQTFGDGNRIEALIAALVIGQSRIAIFLEGIAVGTREKHPTTLVIRIFVEAVAFLWVTYKRLS